MPARCHDSVLPRSGAVLGSQEEAGDLFGGLGLEGAGDVAVRVEGVAMLLCPTRSDAISAGIPVVKPGQMALHIRQASDSATLMALLREQMPNAKPSVQIAFDLVHPVKRPVEDSD